MEPQDPIVDDAVDKEVVLASYSITLTLRGPRGVDDVPTIAELEEAIEQAFPGLAMNASATRTDR